MIFLHGMAASSGYWLPLIDKLSNSFRCIAPDLLGFGRSPKPSEADYSLWEHIAAITASIKLKPGEPVILVGHSMGCILTTALAQHYGKRVQKVILINPPLFDSSKEARQVITGGRLRSKLFLYGPTAFILCKVFCLSGISRLILPLRHKNWPQEVIQNANRHSWISYSRSLKQVLENGRILSRLETAPSTLVLHGQNDHLAHAAGIAKLSGYPNVQTCRLEGLGHHPVLESPDLVATKIKRFLRT